MQSRQDYIEMRLPASAEYVSLIRLTLSGVFSRAGASYDDIEDSKIAVSEAVTNAVKHAYKQNTETGMIDFLREGGLGLFLIESLMDEVKVYKESGVTISMIKYIKKEQVRNNGERVEIS